jgi:hypothetical protein
MDAAAGDDYMIGNRFWRVNVVAITGEEARTTPLASAGRAWKSLAVLLRRGLLSFVALLFLMLPSNEVNDGRERLDDPRQQCGPLKLDFSDPCNAAAIALF